MVSSRNMEVWNFYQAEFEYELKFGEVSEWLAERNAIENTASAMELTTIGVKRIINKVRKELENGA